MSQHAFVYFSPKEHAHGLDAIVCETREDFFRHALIVSGERPDPDMRAFCWFDHESKGPGYGKLVFLRQHLDRSIVVHECVHGAMLFVQHVVMASEAVVVMTEEEQADYYHEACAQVTQMLFEQVTRAFFARERAPVPPRGPASEPASLSLQE